MRIITELARLFGLGVTSGRRESADVSHIRENASRFAEATLLGATEIDEEIRERRLIVEPFLPREREDPCSLDLRLDNYFGVFRTTGEAALDPARPSRAIEFHEIPFFHIPFYVQPGAFVLAQTLEFVSLPTGLAATLDGRSSLGRRGLVVHATAGWVDPLFNGHVTLELANLGVMPLALYPGMRIARIAFHRVGRNKGYEGQFQRQLRIRVPKLDSDCVRIQAYARRHRQ